MKKILVINLGSTSTKIAFYLDKELIIQETINHPAKELTQFNQFIEQIDYRKQHIENFLTTNHIDRTTLDAIASRGGNTQPVESGIYKVTPLMIEQQLSGKYGQHPTDLGSSIAYQFYNEVGVLPIVVDPPVSDEYSEIAKVSGHPAITRRSSVHALNHKAVAKQYANEINMPYEDLNLIIVHMGGGVTVVPHNRGRMIDGSHGLNGENCFTTNRSGALPLMPVIEMCFSGQYSKQEVTNMVNGKGGLLAYLGSSDVKEIEANFSKNPKNKFYLDAMIYQISKDIGAMTAVLKGQVDAVLLTGGIAHSKYVVGKLQEYCGFIAPFKTYPGEKEMEALAFGAHTALLDPDTMKEIDDYVTNLVK